ncbi:MAG: N,N-dimethylformamidase beta subunit family domain-containing protein [Nocardioidaceae bacterium]
MRSTVGLAAVRAEHRASVTALGRMAAPRHPPAPRGTQAWQLHRPARHGEIEGFTTAISAPAGADVGLKVSTTARTYTVRAYRIGWYRGGHGLQVWQSRVLPGRAQGGPRFLDQRTRTVVAPWQRTVSVDTTGWADGFYLFKLQTGTGWQALAPYVVRSRSTVGKVALVAPVATWEAYNDWGGYSLYHGPVGDRRSWAVSFDRPFPDPGAGDMRYGVIPLVVAAERAGVPLAYLTDVDLDADPGLLSGAMAYVSMGHDEYWSPAMRAAVLRARDSGTNLAFFGANTMYWRVRLSDEGPGVRRVVVGYRTDAGLDPLRTTDPGRATGRTRDLLPGQPEDAITGMLYECYPVDAPYRVVSPRWWGFAGTGVGRGRAFAHLVGIEADRVYPGPTTPRPLQILASAPYSCDGVPTTTESTYYSAPSGAGVFDAGTLRWSCALDRRCGPASLGRPAVRFVQQVTRTVLRGFAAGPAGLRHPAVDNVADFHLPPTNDVPAS